MPFARVRTGGYTRVFTAEVGGTATIALPITETWTAADGSGLTADYPWVPIVAGWAISGNAATLTGPRGATTAEKIALDFQTNDYRVRAPVVTFPQDRSGTQVIGVCARMGTDLTYYSASLVCVDAGPASLVLARWLAGAQTVLGSVSLGTLSLPNDLAVSVKGAAIVAWWAGRRQILATDFTIPTGTAGGVQGVAQLAANTGAFSAITFEAVPAALRRRASLTPLTGAHA